MDNCNNKKTHLEFETTNLVAGLPRTGKTYSVLYSLLVLQDSFSIYSNISGVEIGDSYSVSDLSSKLSILHSLFLQLMNDPTKNETEELKKKQIELDFFVPKDGKSESILVIDEAMNFFSKENPAFLFLLSYASRFNIRVVLIAQNLEALHKNYRNLITNFYRMVPLHQRFSFGGKSFVCKFYGNSTDLVRRTDHVSVIRFPVCDDVFKLYKTPNYKSNTKNIVSRLYVLFFLLLFFIVLGFYSFISPYFSTSDLDSQEVVKNVEVLKPVKEVKKVSYSSSFYSLYHSGDFYFLLSDEAVSSNQVLYGSVGLVRALPSEFFEYLKKIKIIKIKLIKGGVYYVKVKNINRFYSYFVFVRI